MFDHARLILVLVCAILALMISTALVPQLAALITDFMLHCNDLRITASRIASRPSEGLGALIALLLIAGLVGWIISMLKNSSNNRSK